MKKMMSLQVYNYRISLQFLLILAEVLSIYRNYEENDGAKT